MQMIAQQRDELERVRFVSELTVYNPEMFCWMKLGVIRGIRIGITLIVGEGSLLISTSWLGDNT